MANIFKVNNKDTRTMSGASLVNSEHILHFILLSLLLNLNNNKQTIYIYILFYDIQAPGLHTIQY